MKKTKPQRLPFGMDERNKQIAQRVMTVMYLLTIIALQLIILYRQFILGQDLDDFQDFAIVLTVNSVFLISALLYFGAVQIRRLKVMQILLIYLVLVALGSLFTYFKYNVFQEAGLDAGQLLEKLIAIATILGLMMGFWIILSILAKRRLDKELE